MAGLEHAGLEHAPGVHVPQASESESLLGRPRTATPNHVEAFEASMRDAVAARPKAKAKQALKRPSAAPAAPGPVLKRPAGSPMTGGHDARPAVPLDGVPAEVMLYLGGRIYDDPTGQRLLCYRQIGDRVEKTISYKVKSRAECFLQAFREIENDPRTADME